MTEQERQNEYYELSKLKQNLEKDRSALNARRTGYEEGLVYILRSIEKLEHWDTGARSFPDLRNWPTADDIQSLHDACEDNEKRLRKVKHQLDNFQL